MNERKVDLFILESTWEDTLISEMSVRPFFDGISRIDGFNYIYHKFYSEKEIRYFVNESRRQKLSCSNYYIAAHGGRKSIHGLKNNIIKKESMQDIFKNSRGKGIYFGSCNFINPKNAEEIMNYTKADWVAGFNSTIIDIIFWHNYFKLDEDKRIAWNVAKKLYKKYPLSIQLEFSVFDKAQHGKKVNNSLQDFKQNIEEK